MTGSGALFSDAFLTSLGVYVFNGGWIVTGLGLVLCLVLREQPGRSRTAWIWAGACLAPALYIGSWALLDLVPGGTPRTSNAAIAAVLAGLAITTLAAPVAVLPKLLIGRPALRP